MQTYEMLCVLPGTLAENEVEPVAEAIKTTVSERGGMVSMFQDLGKSRLSYPMNHIRYGYFRLCRFEAEPTQVGDIEKRLRMMNDVLRIFLTKLHPKNVGMNTIQFVSSLPGERSEVSTGAAETSIPIPALPEEAAVAGIQMPSAEKPEKQEEKRIKLEDIDKKLDEILEKDITDQL